MKRQQREDPGPPGAVVPWNEWVNNVAAVTQLLLTINNIGYTVFGVSQTVTQLIDLAKSQFCLCLQNKLPIVRSLFWCQLKKALSCSLHLDSKQMHKMVPVLHSSKQLHKMVPVLHSPKSLTLTSCDVLNWNRKKNPMSKAHENSFWRRIFSTTSWIMSLCKVYSSTSYGLAKWPSCAWRAVGSHCCDWR